MLFYIHIKKVIHFKLWATIFKKGPLPNICHTYLTMMKLGMVIPYLKKIQKYVNQVTHLLSSTDIRIFLLEISNFCHNKKFRYRL